MSQFSKDALNLSKDKDSCMILFKQVVFVLNQLLSYKCTGHPGEQDSENSTIYITGLTENATLPEMADFFKHCGPIRVSSCVSRSGMGHSTPGGTLSCRV